MLLGIILDEVHFLILETLKLTVNLCINNVEMVVLKSVKFTKIYFAYYLKLYISKLKI